MGVLARRFGRHRGATAAVEFVFVLPVMLTLFAGVVEFGRAWQVYGAVNRLATRYALSWADCSDQPSGTCQTELALYTSTSAMRNVAPQLTGTLSLRMIELQRAGASAVVLYASPSGATPTADEMTVAQTAIGSGQIGVLVTVSYTHTLTFFSGVMSPFLGATRTVSTTVAQLKS